MAHQSSPQPSKSAQPWSASKPTALVVLADGTIIEGKGAGATGIRQAEICFNTAMTGYQEILTDPSYASQIVTFTFPHVGNVGVNDEDVETLNLAAAAHVAGAIFKADISAPSNWRATRHFNEWLKARDIVAISGVDTRALAALIRQKGLANAVIAHEPSGKFNTATLRRLAADWKGLEGSDLACDVTSKQISQWSAAPWQWDAQHGANEQRDLHIVAIDFGIKRNILRLLGAQGARVTVLPASAGAEQILACKPDGVFLSNGPGDPAATGAAYAIAAICGVLETDIPVFGICLGHQMLGLALGAKTLKMHQGHHGANHPVKDHSTGKVEIVSMNHGFAIDAATLPAGVEETHISLFDGSNCGIAVKGRPVFSVQHHPEASPGPRDSHYLFDRFAQFMRSRKGPLKPVA